jgi:hypothetical protein
VAAINVAKDKLAIKTLWGDVMMALAPRQIHATVKTIGMFDLNKKSMRSGQSCAFF